MTNFELSLVILNDMIDHGYFMFGETAEHMIQRSTDDPAWWEKARDWFFQCKGITK